MSERQNIRQQIGEMHADVKWLKENAEKDNTRISKLESKQNWFAGIITAITFYFQILKRD